MDAITPLTRRLTVTSHEWMMPVAMLGMTKAPGRAGRVGRQRGPCRS